MFTKKLKVVLSLFFMVLLLSGISACGKSNKMDKLSDKAHEMMDKAGDKMDDAGKSIENMKDKLQKKAKETKDSMTD